MGVPGTGLTIGGAIAAALAASACCLGPLILAMIGLGGAGAALALQPYRPYLLMLTGVLLGGAFYTTYRRPVGDCRPGDSCAMPAAGRAGKVMLWVATVFIVLAVTFPYYSAYLF